jgi:kynurenine formamidase
MNFERVIDLTLPIVPGQGSRPFVIERGRTEELTDHVPVDHDWYIMHRVTTISHIGTHIEAPYHCFPDGRDLSSIPLEQLVGEAVVLDLSDLEPDSTVGAAEMAAIAEAAGGIREGDIIFLRTGYANLQNTPAFEHRPSLTAESMAYLVERGVKLVGTDLSGLEGPRTPGHLDCHLVLLGNEIPFIENLTNLDALTKPRVFVCALPIPVHGLDAFPLRVAAFE